MDKTSPIYWHTKGTKIKELTYYPLLVMSNYKERIFFNG